MLDPDEGVNKHMVPSHYFDKGDYEVWAKRGYDGGMKLELIANGLSLRTAQAYNWPYKEIHLNGNVIQ